MLSEIMSAFTVVGEMKTKNGEKYALFSIKCPRGALAHWKKNTSVDEKEKFEVKLHAALVLNITCWECNLRT